MPFVKNKIRICLLQRGRPLSGGNSFRFIIKKRLPAREGAGYEKVKKRGGYIPLFFMASARAAPI